MSGKRIGTAFGSGLLFGAGLLISGMADPNKVLGFLDVFGDWDPTLLFVMGGAIAVHAPAYALIKRRARPMFAQDFAVPSAGTVDRALIGGAALFGVGWGIGGYCPGPSVVALPSGQLAVAIFVAAMIAGMWITTTLRRSQAQTELRADSTVPAPH